MFYSSDFMNISANGSYIRLFHASPDAPPVDIYINDKIAARNLSYRNFTNYFATPPGTYNVKVYPTGRATNPVINTSLVVRPNSIATIAAINRLPNIALYTIPEPYIQTRPGRTYVRVVHLSPNAPAVDLAVADGTRLFRDVTYKEITDYLELTPGRYNLQLLAAGTNNVVLRVPNMIFLPNRYLTVYVIGLINERPQLQVVIPMDGNTYLRV